MTGTPPAQQAPYAGVDASVLPPAHAAVVTTARQQFETHAAAGARTVRQQAAWYDLKRIGYKGSARMRVSVTDDRMLWCHTASGGALLWCAYLGDPNELAIRYGELWFTRVGDHRFPELKANPFRLTFYSAFGASSPWTTRSRITAVFFARGLRSFLGTLGVEPLRKSADLRRHGSAADAGGPPD